MATTLLKRLLTPVIALSLLGSLPGVALAGDWSGLDKKKQTRLGLYMTADDAYKHTMDNMDKTLFVDIRTPSELNYLGAVTVMDAHVPLVFMDTTAWNDKKHRYKRANNTNFVSDIDAALKKKGLGKDDTVILMCRSGSRSAFAADKLADAGYTKVYNVVDGYEGDKAKDGTDKGRRTVNGWKNSGLPWTYSLNRDYMYFTR
jgi:rhodanese-related sulfurtransferase